MIGSRHFDPAAVRGLAGNKVFARGEAYHRSGQVRILALEPRRVLARVAGTEDYLVELTGAGEDIGGECSCPAFEDWGFCKHMVATALAANTAAEAGDTGSEAPAAPRIRAYLAAKGVDALVEMVMDHAERDEAWFRALDMASAAAGADDKDLERRLRRAIDSATRTRDFIDYREARGWAAGVEAVLDTLAELAPGPRAGLVMTLVERVIDKVEEATGSIDDSDGYCGALPGRAAEIHLRAAGAACVDPVLLARDLFRRELDSEYGPFEGAAEVYGDILGDAGRAEYRRLAMEAWDRLPPLSRAGRGAERDSDYRRLMAILDRLAEDDRDVGMRIALRAKKLTSSYEYLALAEFCLEIGRPDEALRRAEEGLWLFEDDRCDERLVGFAADRLCEAGRTDEAFAHLWRAFQSAPNLDLHARLVAIGGPPARQKSMAFLESRLEKAEPASRWHSPADLPICILIGEGEWEKAWALLRRKGASGGVKEALARATEKTHPAQAAGVYAERVEALVEGGGARAYAEAAALVRCMKRLQAPAEHAAYVVGLKARFGRRRTFVPLLD